MTSLKFCLSRSCFFNLIVILSIIISIQASSQVPISRQTLLLDSLTNIDDQIERLAKKLSLKSKQEESEFQSKNQQQKWTVSQIMQKGLSQLYQKLPQLSLYDIKAAPEERVRVKNICAIAKTHNSKGESNVKYHYFTSQGELFIFVSEFQTPKLQIYSMECELIARINSLAIKFLFDQEKGPSSSYNSNSKDQPQNQLVYLISHKSQLIALDLLEIKKRGKQSMLYDESQNQPKIYRVLNNKLIAQNQNVSIIGVLIKTINQQSTQSREGRSSGSYREKSLFVAFDSSQIKVFDEMGTQKISMKQPSIINDFYEETNPEPNALLSISDKAVQFVDFHPQPILVEQNWIYFVDTGKYSRQAWGCPYIPNVKKVFIENYHDSEVYILTDQRIFKINAKAKDSKDLSKKGLCEIERSIPYFDPNLKQKKTDEIKFSVYKNLIFLDNLVYNMTSLTYLKIATTNQLRGKQSDNDPLCQKYSIHPFPNIPLSSKKTPLQKHHTFIHQCQKSNETEISLFTVTQIKSETSLLVYIIVGFMIVIFFAVKCFKSTGSSYEKELLYPVNFDAQQREVRKQHYEQLKKYMDEARRIQEQEKNSKNKQTQTKDTHKKQPTKKQSKSKKQ